MIRKDVKAARDAAAAFVKASDDLLAIKWRRWNHEDRRYEDAVWHETGLIAGKATGAHRRSSLDLTRALAHMRRRL